jgi:hypothetical protein
MLALEVYIFHRIAIDRGLFQTNKETVRKLICFEIGRRFKRSGRMMHLKQIQIRSILGNRIRIQISFRVKSWIRIRIKVKIKKLQISKWSHGGPWRRGANKSSSGGLEGQRSQICITFDEEQDPDPDLHLSEEGSGSAI